MAFSKAGDNQGTENDWSLHSFCANWTEFELFPPPIQPVRNQILKQLEKRLLELIFPTHAHKTKSQDHAMDDGKNKF